jgi:hypothetical protein
MGCDCHDSAPRVAPTIAAPIAMPANRNASSRLVNTVNSPSEYGQYSRKARRTGPCCCAKGRGGIQGASQQADGDTAIMSREQPIGGGSFVSGLDRAKPYLLGGHLIVVERNTNCINDVMIDGPGRRLRVAVAARMACRQYRTYQQLSGLSLVGSPASPQQLAGALNAI